MKPEVIGAQAQLNKLEAEAAALPGQIAELQKQMAAFDARLAALYPGWHSPGELALQRLRVRDAAFPVLEAAKNEWTAHTKRIIAVDEKWITTRVDYAVTEVRYRRSDGAREGTRAGQLYLREIDVEKALTIWNNHLAEGGAL